MSLVGQQCPPYLCLLHKHRRQLSLLRTGTGVGYAFNRRDEGRRLGSGAQKASWRYRPAQEATTGSLRSGLDSGDEKERDIVGLCIQYHALSNLILQPGHFRLFLLQNLHWAQGCSLLGGFQALFLD